MQQMPDKQFDKLFQDHFADAEIEPSRDLWAAIESEIAPKKKYKLPVYWMAAASVAVAFTAMLVFQKEEKILLRGKNTTVAMVDTAAPQANQTNPMMGATKSVNFASTSNNDLAQFKASLKKYTENQVVEQKNENFAIAMQPSQAVEHLPIKRTEVKPLDVTPKQEETIQNQVMYANVEPIKDERALTIGADTEVNPKKSINSMGDLVNFVVDKVDKRDRKLIEFGNDSDGSTEVIGINIGFLKWNKKHKANNQQTNNQQTNNE